MILINLLPWREQKREALKKQFFYCLVGAVAFTLVLILLIYLILLGQMQAERSANQYLNDQIAGLDIKIAKIKTLKEQRVQLIQRMRLIEGLQSARTSTVRLLDDIARIVPKGVFLREVQRKGDHVLLIGKSESNTRISDLMRNIERSSGLEEPLLTEIKADDNDKNSLTHDFQLDMRISTHAKKRTVT